MATPRIFDDHARGDNSYPEAGASTYGFLDASSHEWADNIRQTLNDWFLEYPDGEDKRRLLGLLRSRKEVEFASAFFELYVHALVTRQGFKLKPHPEPGPDGKGHVDFLAIGDNPTVSFLVEAAVVEARPEESDTGFARLRNAETLRKKILKKGSQYGGLDRPYIVATNVQNMFFRNEDVWDALLGDEQITITRYSNGTTTETEGRARDGSWFQGQKPRYTRISGLLAVADLTPFNVATRTPQLFHNPWATKPVRDLSWTLSQHWIDLRSGEIEAAPGSHGGDLFGLCPDWPNS